MVQVTPQRKQTFEDRNVDMGMPIDSGDANANREEDEDHDMREEDGEHNIGDEDKDHESLAIIKDPGEEDQLFHMECFDPRWWYVVQVTP